MASTVDHTSGARAIRRQGEATAAALDRARDFRRARRHTLMVTTMRYALPLATLAMAGVFGFTVLQRAGWGVSVPDIPIPKILPENLTMNNPRYEGFNADGGRYVVSALTAQQDFGNTQVIKLNSITGVMHDAADVRTDLTAGRGTFDNQQNKLELEDNVDIVSTNGMKAKLKTALVEIKAGIITSKDPVQVWMTAGTVRAEEMQVRHKAREVTFQGSVETHLDSGKPKEETAAPQPKSPTAARPFGASDQPIDVFSSRLDVNDTTKIAVFTGAVRAVQAGATLQSPELKVTYAGQAPGMPAAAAGKATAPKPADGEPAAQQGKVKHILASGPVVMTQATGDRATADRAEFDAETAKAILDGQVVMTQAPDRRATSNRAELDQRAETVLLTGNVLVNQGRNELKGQRLYSDRKAGRTRLTAAAADGGNGRIAARFFRATPVDTDAAKAEAKPVLPGAIGGSFKTDPNAPIDIASDSLDVNDQRKAAVFLGDVQAVQDGFTMRTVEMTAFYSGEAGLGSGLGAAPAKDAAGKGSADLQRIEARRSVVVKSKDGQTATGEWANYDTKRNMVTLGGDVVLTQGPNVVRGSRLIIDMTTGQSVIETDPSAAWSARAQPAGGTADAKPLIEAPVVQGRPRAVFYPKALKDRMQAGGKQAAPAAGTTAAPAKPTDAKKTDTWGSTTLTTRERDN